MGNLQLDYEMVKRELNNKLSHPYLLQYIDNPFIDEKKLKILVAILRAADLPERKLVQYGVATSLVDIALNTHELVTNDDYQASQIELQTKRQLTVLGGIYYSSLYYVILAELGSLELTKKLAIEIKNINEEKVYLYNQKATTIKELVTTVTKIETALYSCINDYLKLPKIDNVISQILIIDRLKQEKSLIENFETSPFIRNLRLIITEELSSEKLTLEEVRELAAICDQVIEEAQESLNNLCGENKAPHLEDFITSSKKGALN